jgi:hypothetical protein
MTNDASVSVVPDRVKIGWDQDAERIDEVWIGGRPLAPGDWTAFHSRWPEDVPTTWTPVFQGLADANGATDHSLALTLGPISEASPTDTFGRTYTANVTNGNSFAVSSLSVIGVERDADTDAFIDTLDACAPDSIGPGETAEVTFTGMSEWDGTATPDVRVFALEHPTITLSADTLAPYYGSPITFQINLKHSDGTPATGDRTLKIYWSSDGDNWDSYEHYPSTTGSATGQLVPSAPTYYKAVYWGGDDLGWTESAVLFARPRVAITTPYAPPVVRSRKYFSVSGRLSAGLGSLGKPVTLRVDRKSGSRWVNKVKTTVKPDLAGRYKKAVRLSTTGTYRIRAYRPGVGYSPYKSFKVKK